MTKYLHLPSMAVGDTTPLDHPSNCECGGKGCDCACHLPTRDNTNTDDDLELDVLKHENMALAHEAKDLRQQLDDVNHMHDVARAEIAETRTFLAEFERAGPTLPYAVVALLSQRTSLQTELREAIEHLDEFASLGLVDGIKALRVALITARAELDRLKAERDALAKSERAKSDLLKRLAEIAECEPEAERLELRISMLMAVFGAVEIAPVERITAERDAARAELAATKAGADHLQTSLARANARIADLTRERDDFRDRLRDFSAQVLSTLAKLGVRP